MNVGLLWGGAADRGAIDSHDELPVAAHAARGRIPRDRQVQHKRAPKVHLPFDLRRHARCGRMSVEKTGASGRRVGITTLAAGIESHRTAAGETAGGGGQRIGSGIARVDAADRCRAR